MKKRALLIGINNYHLLGKLNFARQDAEAVAEALCRYCGYSSHDITLMTCQGEGATLGLSNYIEHALMDIASEPDIETLIFGFWGHGFCRETGKRFLCGMDTTEHDLIRTAVSMDVVLAKLSQASAMNSILILDCCQSKPIGRSAGAEPLSTGEEKVLSSMARDIHARHVNRTEEQVPTVAILNACREGQRAYEWENRKHGIFTAHLLDGLCNNVQSIGAMSNWLYDRVSKTANDLYRQQQTPYFTIEGRGDIVLSSTGSNSHHTEAYEDAARSFSSVDKNFCSPENIVNFESKCINFFIEGRIVLLRQEIEGRYDATSRLFRCLATSFPAPLRRMSNADVSVLCNELSELYASEYSELVSAVVNMINRLYFSPLGRKMPVAAKRIFDAKPIDSLHLEDRQMKILKQWLKMCE